MTMPTALEIVCLYLYGRNTPPADLTYRRPHTAYRIRGQVLHSNNLSIVEIEKGNRGQILINPKTS